MNHASKSEIAECTDVTDWGTNDALGTLLHIIYTLSDTTLPYHKLMCQSLEK